jgi:hypothetical protein
MHAASARCSGDGVGEAVVLLGTQRDVALRHVGVVGVFKHLLGLEVDEGLV